MDATVDKQARYTEMCKVFGILPEIQGKYFAVFEHMLTVRNDVDDTYPLTGDGYVQESLCWYK
jgi:hypothetical protein